MPMQEQCSVVQYFYPRPPRGGRPRAGTAHGKPCIFLSTPSARRATGYPLRLCVGLGKFLSTPSARRATFYAQLYTYTGYISIHALREEGDPFLYLLHVHIIISIHALREEGDFVPAGHDTLQGHFYPRPPRGGRRRNLPLKPASRRISIHALREEGDEADRFCNRKEQNFYPRPPRGGRRLCVGNHGQRRLISIHALREEGDFWFYGHSYNE